MNYDKTAAKTQQNTEICCESAAGWNTWPEILADIPMPDLSEIEDLLQSEEENWIEFRKAEEKFQPELRLSRKSFVKREMRVAGLRLIREILLRYQGEDDD